MILTVLILIIVLFLCENTNSLCLFFFSSIFQDKAVVANLKYFGYKTVTNVLLPLKEIKKKKEFGMELFLKEYVKIKDPNEII